jgi:hypothetical protein
VLYREGLNGCHAERQDGESRMEEAATAIIAREHEHPSPLAKTWLGGAAAEALTIDALSARPPRHG